MKKACIAVLTLVVLTAPASGQFRKIKKIMDKAETLADLKISDEEEYDLGSAISANIRAIYGVEQNEEVTRYVSLVGLVVAEESGRDEVDYRFIVLDSDSTNAFAAPGGFIHITRGALALIQDEAELAGVLAHEVAHVAERHTIKSIQAMRGIKLVNSETQSLQPGAPVFDQLVEVGTELTLKGYGRDQELESDKEGVRTAAEAGYHPRGLGQFLTSLKQRYAGWQKKAGLFASHPQLDERLGRLTAEIAREELEDEGTAVLAERFTDRVSFESVAFTGTGPAVAGTMGVAEGGEAPPENAESEKKTASEGEEKKEEKTAEAGTLAALSNPFASGDKQERAEVTGTAGARGVETELGNELPGNPALVDVTITQEELDKFRKAGGLA